MSINIFEYGKSAIRVMMYSASFSLVCLRYSRVVVCHLNTRDKKAISPARILTYLFSTILELCLKYIYVCDRLGPITDVCL